MAQQWHVQERPGQEGIDSQKREEPLYKLANTCTAMIREKHGVVGDVARLIEGSLIASPIDPVHIQRHFGDLKGFGAVDELAMKVTGGVPVNAVTSGADPKRALQYGNHSSVTENLTAVWKKNRGRRQAPKMLSDTVTSRARNPRSQSLSAGGGRDTKGSDNQ